MMPAPLAGPPDDAPTLLGEPGASRVVLVVDDEPSIRLVLRRTLVRDGWIVEEASDGPAAQALLRDRSRPYAAVVLDVSLPGMSGAQLYEWLSGERPELLGRLVIASGAPSPFFEDVGRPVLPKPFEITAVRDTVRQVADAADAADADAAHAAAALRPPGVRAG